MPIAIGCPVRKREWILPTWFDHVEAACEKAGQSPTYVFVADPTDRVTVDLILAHTNGQAEISFVTEPGRPDVREWGDARYAHMTNLRNTLLQTVRWLQPTWFLSVDSDILLHPEVLSNLIQTTEERGFGAVGGRLYMTPSGTWCPSNALLGREGGLRRIDSDGVFPVDVIMAVKLMTQPAYMVDYSTHRQGEDIGWCKNATNAGVKLGWDGRVISKHVLNPEMLDVVDTRVGF